MSFFDNFEDVKIDNFGLIRLPEIKLTPEQKKLVTNEEHIETAEFFKQLVRKALLTKKAKLVYADFSVYEARVERELQTLEELGFIDYCLLVWLVIEKAREFGAFIDAGRGSMGGALCFYLLDITGADPIEHNLLFERFVNRARSKKEVINGDTFIYGELAPDCDINIASTRERVKKWLEEIYPQRISKIATYSTFTGKILIKDVYKAFNEVSEDEAKRVADLIEKNQGIVEDIESMVEKNEDFKLWTESHPETFQVALMLRDLYRQSSCHASGYLVSYYPLDGFVPLECNKDGDLMCSFSKDDAALFAIKLDLLGLITSDVLKAVEHVIPETFEEIMPKLKEDPFIYKHFQDNSLLPYGLYQISADTAYRVAMDVKTANLSELSDVNAIARPGALAYLKDYVGRTGVCPHPAFKEILGETRNQCLYQEQMLRMAMAIGFTGEEAEQLRRIVGKKKIDEVAKWKDKIYQMAEKNGFEKVIGDILWKILEDSARYSFNKSHALCTSITSALTIYLKYKYPVQFYWACLRASKHLPNPHEEIAAIERELINFNIKLLPPDLVLSDLDFKIEGNNIRFGIAFIKGVSDKTLSKIRQFCEKDRTTKFQLFQAMRQCGLNVGVGAALVQAGCLSDYSKSRSRLVLELQTWNLLTDKEKRLATNLGEKMNYDVLSALVYLRDGKDEDGKPYIKPSRWATIFSKYEIYKKIWQQNSKNEKFANWWYERAILGFSYSAKLKDVFDGYVDGLMPLSQIKTEVQEIRVKGIGVISKGYTSKSKKGTPYAKFSIEDESASVDVMIFGGNSGKLELCKEANGGLPEEDDIVIFRGTLKEGGKVFADEIITQTSKIYMKLADLKKDVT